MPDQATLRQQAYALHLEGKPHRLIAMTLGITRSKVGRMLKDEDQKVNAERYAAMRDDRAQAGDGPLPAGHPLSWQAISVVPFQLSGR